MVAIADTRVSWRDGQRPPRDLLKKLYVCGDETKAAVLGFCANHLEGARTVMTFLRDKKFRHYQPPFAIVPFRDRLRNWIEEIAVQLPPEQRDGLQFLLCGIEPSRRPRAFRTVIPTAGGAPFIEPHIYKFVVRADGRVSVNTQSASLVIIGSGRAHEREIRKKINDAFQFGFAQGNLHWARAFLMGYLASALFQEADSRDVGGVFEVVRIAHNGVQVQYVWPSGSESASVEVANDEGRVLLRNPVLNESRTLYPIWDELLPERLAP